MKADTFLFVRKQKIHLSNWPALTRTIAFIALAISGMSACNATCSRVINVPVSPTGLSVITTGDTVHGIFPDLLRKLGQKNACSFDFPVVPRSRQEAMFEAGTSDLLVTSIKTPRRDEFGTFIPLVKIRATLISIASARATISSFQELIKQRDMRLVLVRGYDYGADYQQLITELNKQGRVILEADPLSVARVIKASPADATIMAPSIFVGAIQGDSRVEDLANKLRFESLDELPWSYSGTYISKKSLNLDDKKRLDAIFDQATASGDVWKGYRQYYSAEIIKISVRPLQAN